MCRGLCRGNSVVGATEKREIPGGIKVDCVVVVGKIVTECVSHDPHIARIAVRDTQWRTMQFGAAKVGAMW
jgi:hypothetical protein